MLVGGGAVVDWAFMGMLNTTTYGILQNLQMTLAGNRAHECNHNYRTAVWISIVSLKYY